MTVDQQSYLLVRAAKAAMRDANGDTTDAEALLADRLAFDKELRAYIAHIAISEIVIDEVLSQFGTTVGSA